MKVEYAKPFVKAVTDVLSMMAMITPKAGKPYVKKANTANGDVSGLVGITGELNGTISITFTKSCAITVVKNMLGGELQDVMQDVRDAVGEITNMISGQARAGLAEQGLVFSGATPSVIMGDNHIIAHVANTPVMAIPFTCEAGDFTVEFSFE